MHNYPKRVIISISPFCEDFRKAQGVDGNPQVFEEITREIFDLMDNTFTIFTKQVYDLPKIENLVNYVFLLDHPNTLRLLKNAVCDYALALYFICHDNGVIVNEKCIYMLESVHADYCVLYYRN